MWVINASVSPQSSATSPTPVRKDDDDDDDDGNEELFVAGLVLMVMGSLFLIIAALFLTVGVVLIVWYRKSTPTESYNMQENGKHIYEN